MLTTGVAMVVMTPAITVFPLTLEAFIIALTGSLTVVSRASAGVAALH